MREAPSTGNGCWWDVCEVADCYNGTWPTATMDMADCYNGCWWDVCDVADCYKQWK